MTPDEKHQADHLLIRELERRVQALEERLAQPIRSTLKVGKVDRLQDEADRG